MADAISQANRLMSIKTPLADDLLCIDRASIIERVSQPFGMQCELLAEVSNDASIKHDAIVGKSVTLTVELPDKKKRYFNGMVSRFSRTGRDERFATYRAEVVPWLWLLTLSSDSKVFQDLTIPDIIEKVFKEWTGKFSDLVKFENKLQGSYTKVDYCVQYRETDFNFVSRLMEQEGIFYFFKHEDGKHTLVLGDDASAFTACPHLEQARFLPESGMGEWEDGVTSYEYRHSMVPGKYVTSDYHFMLANKGGLHQSQDGAAKIGNNSSLEIFDFPGEFAQRFNKPDERMGEVEKHGKEIAKLRMEEQALGHISLNGTSSARAFSTGCYFSLVGKDKAAIKVPGTEGKYVLTSVKHMLQQSPDYVSGGGVSYPYRNSFTATPHEVPYRPARATSRPSIQGVQTAVVVGIEGEEIDTDKYGRVKVQFPWDREGKKNENSSCWIRVATMWGGAQWGMIHIPRIGQEVVVSFVEGDPDQPIIVGSVYNFDNMPPYTLPDNKTRSGIVTRSTKKGDKETYNEIHFEDKKGEELLYLRAEKDHTRAVENDETIWVGHDRWADVDNDETINIANNETVTIDKGNQKHTLKKGNREAIIEMGNEALTIKMGNQTTKLNLGKSDLEAMQSIELKVGQSSLKIDQMGVTIKGMMINVEGTLQTSVKGLMSQVQGTAMLQVGGGILMLG